MKQRQLLAILGAGLLCAAPSLAEPWKQEVVPYLWGSSLQGSTTIGSVTAAVDLGFGDIVDNLEMGFMGAYRASKDRWSITVDALYMGLGATRRGPNGLLAADMDIDQTSVEFDVGYALTDQLTVLGGARYANVSASITGSTPVNTLASASSDQDWVDPVIGAQLTLPLSGKWSFSLRGDVGGFGIGSDLAWQGVAALRFQASDRVGIVAAYRYIDTNYDSGSGAGYFRYDVVTAGPTLGVAVAF